MSPYVPWDCHCGRGWVSDSVCSAALFLLFDHSVQPQREGFCIAFLYLLCCVWLLSLGFLLFWWQVERKWIQGREESGGKWEEWKEGKLVGVYFIREESTWKKKKGKTQPKLQSGKQIKTKRKLLCPNKRSILDPQRYAGSNTLEAHMRRLGLWLSEKSLELSGQSSDPQWHCFVDLPLQFLV